MDFGHVKVTYVKNNNEGEFHFDYYNKIGSLVGTVCVNDKGRLFWSILDKDSEGKTLLWDKNVGQIILSTVSFIYGSRVENTTEYVIDAKQEDPKRWERVLIFLKATGMYINQPKDYYNSDYANARKGIK